MNRSKVMFSGLVFSVVFGLMYWYRDLLGNKEITIMDQSLINHFDLKLCLTVAVLSMLLIVVLLYSKEVDPDQYRFEYIRSTLSEDELKRIDGLDKEGRRIAYVSIPWWRSHPIHKNRATESIWTEPCNPLLRAAKSTKRATFNL